MEYPEVVNPHQKYTMWKKEELTDYLFQYLTEHRNNLLEGLREIRPVTRQNVATLNYIHGQLDFLSDLLSDALLDKIIEENDHAKRETTV